MTEQDFSRRLLRGAAIDEEDGGLADLVTYWALFLAKEAGARFDGPAPQEPIWLRETEANGRQRAEHPDWDNRYVDGWHYRLTFEGGATVEARWHATAYKSGPFYGEFYRRGTTSAVPGWSSAEPLEAA